MEINKPARVLIVDDVAAARETLGALLSIDGHQILYAASGDELLANIDQLQPDVILLDVMMPGLDGFEVCRRLRARAEWLHLPIILVTALDNRQDLVTGLDAGADDFLHKPVNGVELRARVRSMLRIKHQFDALTVMLQLREDLANMVVHDMRTPLTAIVGFTELLRGGYIPSGDTPDIRSLHRQVLRLNALVNDILVQAKMESGRLLPNRTDTDVNDLIRQVEDSFSFVVQSRDLRLILDLPADSPLVSVDANLMQRVLDNLLSNALKFSPPNSSITIRAEYPAKAGCSLRLQVIDQGPGVAPEDQQRIFNKYEIAALKSRTDVPVGLGLAFCKLVVDAHGGQIFMADNHPTGSVFTIEI